MRKVRGHRQASANLKLILRITQRSPPQEKTSQPDASHDPEPRVIKPWVIFVRIGEKDVGADKKKKSD